MASVSFPRMVFPHLDAVRLPPVARVRLRHPRGTPITDVTGAARTAVGECARIRALPRGSSVAIAVGSRGITGIVTVVAALVTELKDRELAPFIVPAMGSHGGATAEGQVAVLAKIGVTEATVGAPIGATMDVVRLGATSEGIPCMFDRLAAGADAVVVVNRVKSHTTFDRPIESGLVKMISVGLGKAEGARWVHKVGPRGLSEVLPDLTRIALNAAPIACGVALVESAHKDLVHIEGVEPEHIFARDEALLTLAKSHVARLPFRAVDALVVRRIGKELSGIGMDYAVTGRADIRGVQNPAAPFAAKIAVLRLSEATAGNGLGIGLADFTTTAAADALDLHAMYMNSLTSTLAEKCRIPMVLPTDRDAIAAAVSTSWAPVDEEAKLCLVDSTLYLNEILASPGLLALLPDDDSTEVVSEPAPLTFGDDGQLLTAIEQTG